MERRERVLAVGLTASPKYTLAYPFRGIFVEGGLTETEGGFTVPLSRGGLQEAPSLAREAEMFRTIEEIKQANRALGGHWFDPDTLRFFRGRVLSTVYGGRYFVSSEQYDDRTPRLYTIRQAFADGNIETVGEFQGYRTAQAARIAARKLGEFPLYVERVGLRPHYAVMRDDLNRQAVTRTAFDSYDAANEYVRDAEARASRDCAMLRRALAKRGQSPDGWIWAKQPTPAELAAYNGFVGRGSR